MENTLNTLNLEGDFAEWMCNGEEIKACLNSKHNLSALGLDGLGYRHLNFGDDPMIKLLSLMFKDCVAVRQVPLIRKSSRTLLLYKKGKEYGTKNWRPISIASCAYRLLTAMITQWIQNQHSSNRLQVFSRCQKGFVHGQSGCMEHAVLTREMISHATLHKKDKPPFQPSTNPIITRKASRESLLAISKAETGSKEDWREIVAGLFDEEDEYTWKNRFGQEASPPWTQWQQIVFKLKPWANKNAPGRLVKRPPSPDSSHDDSGPHPPSPPGSSPTADDPSGLGESAPQFQSHTPPTSTRKVAITIWFDDKEYRLSVKPRSAGDELARFLAHDHQIDVPGHYHPRVVFGKGAPARYQDRDVIFFFPATRASIEQICSPRTTAGH
jgi:hypothetical protein